MSAKTNISGQMRRTIALITRGAIAWVESSYYRPQGVTTKELYREFQLLLFGQVYPERSCPVSEWPDTARSFGHCFTRHKREVRQGLREAGMEMWWCTGAGNSALYSFAKDA